MGRHRTAFNKAVLAGIGQFDYSIEWMDFEFDQKAKWPDVELKGIDFLKDEISQEKWDQLKKKWDEFWPTQSGVQNWDAVGWLISGKSRELILVEAKAHTEEIQSFCQAESPESIQKIDHAFEETKKELGIQNNRDWKEEYYQFANRLTFLYFLNKHNMPAMLLFIYFVGDKFPANKYHCPQSKSGWDETLKKQDEYLGLKDNPKLRDKVRKIFLHVRNLDMGSKEC